MELKDQNVLFIYINKTIANNTSLLDLFYIKNLTSDGQWHSISLLEKDKNLHLLLDREKKDNSFNFTLISLFSIKRFALDQNSQITFGRTNNSDKKLNSFKVDFYNFTYLK